MTEGPAADQATVQQIADAVEERVELMADEIVRIAAAEIPFYRRLSPDELEVFRRLSAAEIRSTIQRIRTGSRLIPLGARDAYRRQGEMFAEQGIPLSDLTRTFDVATRVIVPRVLDEAIAFGDTGIAALTQYLLLAMDQLTSVVAIVTRSYRDRANEVDAIRRKLRDDLLTQLLTGPSPAGLPAKAAALQLPRARSYAALAIPVPAHPAGLDRTDLDSRIARILPGTLWVTIGHLLVVVAPAVEDVAEASRSLAVDLAPVMGAQPIVARGRSVPDLLQLKDSFREAADVARAAEAAGLSGSVGPEDVALHRIVLASPEESAELLALLEPLEAYDEHNGGALLPTLRALIDEGFSVGAAADRLGVHRNTLRYRLEVITGVLEADPSDIRLLLKMAFVVRDLGVGATGPDHD